MRKLHDVTGQYELIVLYDYGITADESGKNITFAVPAVLSSLQPDYAPCLYYYGGKHAILMKNRKDSVVFSDIKPELRKALKKAKTVQILEDSSVNEEIGYSVQVSHVGVKTLADDLISKWEKAEARALAEEEEQYEEHDGDSNGLYIDDQFSGYL